MQEIARIPTQTLVEAKQAVATAFNEPEGLQNQEPVATALTVRLLAWFVESSRYRSWFRNPPLSIASDDYYWIVANCREY